MNQFSLFDDEPVVAAPAPTAAPTAAPAHIPQPPAIARVSDKFPEHPAGLKPLRLVPDNWIDRQITDEEFAARRPQFGPECSDEYVELVMLQERGVRTRTSSYDGREPDPAMTYLYEFIDGPFLIRRRTLPGVTVLVWQGPPRTDASA